MLMISAGCGRRARLGPQFHSRSDCGEWRVVGIRVLPPPARCEEQAEDTGDLSLLEVAAKWRKLGNQEKGWKEARKTFPGTISGERALTPPPAAVRSAR